jgi:glutathione S-transferase
MPEDSQGRARVRMLEDYCDNSFIPPTTMLLAQLRKSEVERDTQRVDQAREELRRALYYLRDHLSGQDFLVGKEFSLADAAFAPRIMVLGRLGIELEPALATVQGWIDRIRARPSVRGLGLS